MPEYAPSARRSAAGLAASADVVKLAKCGTRRGSGYWKRLSGAGAGARRVAL